MKIILSTPYGSGPLSFVHSPARLEDLFRIASNLGFGGVDYTATIPDLFVYPHLPLELSKKYGVPIIGIHAPMHLLFYTPPFLLKRLINMASLFPDCEVLNSHLSGYIHPLAGDDTKVRKLVHLAGKKFVPLSFESNPLLFGLGLYPSVTYNPDLFAKFCLDHRLPMTFDTSHIADLGFDVVTFFKNYHSGIKLIHLSDCIGKNQHLPLGRGNLPIKNLLQEVKKHKYKGIIDFEICHFPKNTSLKIKVAEIKESLRLVRQYAG